MTAEYYRILFDANDHVTHTNVPQGVSVQPVDPNTVCELVTLNALDPLVDRKPRQPWHAADKPRRADCNVTSLRSFLLEWDKAGSVEEQLKRVKLMGLPFSTAVHSGGKSLHVVVSLTEPTDAVTYRHVGAMLRAAFPGCDRSVGNPSRLTRAPNVTRSSTDTTQTLLDCRGRVAMETLMAWLQMVPGVGDIKPFSVPKKKAPLRPGMTPVWTEHTRRFLAYSAGEGDRHYCLIRAAYEYALNNIPLDVALEQLGAAWSRCTENREQELEQTIQYAYDNLENPGAT